jgi:Holliday junction resolvase YEN1
MGVIDGILSDDVDNFLFGATTVIRKCVFFLGPHVFMLFTSVHSASNNLSGNRANPVLNADGKDDKNHTRIFRLQDITTHQDIQLNRGGMILIGLMSGGDYQQGGLMRCGVTTAHALARCGFGDSLYEAAINLDRDDLEEFLVAWRHELREELRTNSKGEIGRKQVALAKSISESFPDIDILLSYVRPITSESMGRESNNTRITWSREPDLAKLAATCEFYFEWGYKEAIIKRFRTVIWHSVVLRILRRAVLDIDQKSAATARSIPVTPRKKDREKEACGTPSKMIAKHFSSLTLDEENVYISGSDSEDDDEERLIVKVHSARTHVSTDRLPEYRLEIAPKQLVRLTEAGIQGIRAPEGPDEWASENEEEDEEEGGTKKRGKGQPIDPETHLRVWMPACMVKLVEPRLVQDYEDLQEQKRLKKLKKTTRVPAAEKEKAPRKPKKTAAKPVDDDGDVFSSPPVPRPKKKAAAPTKRTVSAPKPPVDDQDVFSSPIQKPKKVPAPQIRNNLVHEDELASSDPEEYPAFLMKKAVITKPRDETIERHIGREPSEPLSSPVKVRTGIKDLRKKKTSSTTATSSKDLKSFFSVTRGTSTVSSKVHGGNSFQSTGSFQSTTSTSRTGTATTSYVSASTSSQKTLTVQRQSGLQSSSRGDEGQASSLSNKGERRSVMKPSLSAKSKDLDASDDSSVGEYNFAWNKTSKATALSPSPSSKRKKAQRISLSTDSDSQERLKKSPRKKKEENTPQRTRRPISPSPVGSRAFPMQKKGGVIEIMTDSDSDVPGNILPLRRLPPLMAARARSKGLSSLGSSSKSTTTEKPLRRVGISSEVIDLT